MSLQVAASWKGAKPIEIPDTKSMFQLLSQHGLKVRDNPEAIRKHFKRSFRKETIRFSDDGKWIVTEPPSKRKSAETNKDAWQKSAKKRAPSPTTQDMEKLLLAIGVSVEECTASDVEQKFHRMVPWHRLYHDQTDGWQILSDVATGNDCDETLAFDGPDSFRSFFSANNFLMRNLLAKHTKETDIKDVMQIPTFLSKKKVDDTMVEYHFFNTFTYLDCVSTPDGRITLTNVSDIAESTETMLSYWIPKQTEVKTVVKSLNSLNTAATNAERNIERMNQSPKDLAIRNVYRYIRSKNSKDLMADGGDTNAELTENSVNRYCDWLVAAIGLNADSVGFDGGCSYNVFCSHVAQRLGCKMWGTEYVPTRIFIGTGNFLKALEDPDNIGHLVNPKVAYVPLDLFALTSFGNATFGHFFDEAFSESLIHHCLIAAHNTPTMMHITSAKASKRQGMHRTFLTFGWKLKSKLEKVSKFGSNESNTFYLYERTTQSPDADLSVERLRACSAMTGDLLMAKYLKPAWSDSQEQRVAHYRDLHAKALINLDTTTNGRHRKVEKSHCQCDLCLSRHGDKKIMCLGMTLAEVDDTMTTSDLAQLVRRGKMSPMMARDTVRCMKLETFTGHQVYTVSNINPTLASKSQHISADFTTANLPSLIPTKGFQIVVMDYFWMPRSYTHDRIGNGLTILLKNLATKVLSSGGKIYLPFHLDLLEALATDSQSWSSVLSARLLTEEESLANPLYRATLQIEDDVLWEVFGKNPKEQLNEYCTVTKAMYQSSSLTNKSGSPFAKLLKDNKKKIEKFHFIELVLV